MDWLRFVGFSVLVHGALIGFASQWGQLQRPLDLGSVHAGGDRAWSGSWVAVTTWRAPAPRAEPPEVAENLTRASAPEPPVAAPAATAPSGATPATGTARAKPARRAKSSEESEAAGLPPVASSADDDWMSLEQQLPAPRASEPPAPATARPDPWVERLMQAERRKAARQPVQRRSAAAAVAAAPSEAQSPPASARRVGTSDRSSTEATEAAERATPLSSNAGLPRDLLYAFTFALPRAVESSALWDELSLGALGRVRLRIRLEAGHVTATRLLSPSHPAARLVHDKTVSLLRRGQFALGPSGARSGRVVVQVDLQLSQGPARSAVTLWNELPERTSAHFIKPSGRRLDAHVEMFE